MSDTIRFQEALALEQQGDFARAQAIFEELLQSGEQDRGDLLFHRGWCLEQGTPPDPQGALACYRQAAEITRLPLCRMNSCFRAGWVAMQQKAYAEACRWFKMAIDEHEQTPVNEVIYHDALYWLAVCLEALGHYREAIAWHHRVQAVAPRLAPESRFREIHCLNRIGAFEQALAVCRRFTAPPPDGFDPERYNELSSLARREAAALQACLNDDFMQKGTP